MLVPAPPMHFQWQGDGFRPLRPALADKHFVVGANYQLVEHNDRSVATHNHEFAWLHEAWLQLPEALADQFPTETHLRKRALIDAGFYDETITDAGSNAAALRVAALVRSIDDFAWVAVRGHLVVRRTAKSQSRRAMDRKDFQASKSAILEIISGMIGVSPEQLVNQAGKAA